MTLTWKDNLIEADAAVLEAVQVVDHTSCKVAVVVDKRRRLLGVVTDGDIRRGMLAGVSLEDPVSEVMNSRPRAGSVNDTRAFMDAVMRSQGIQHLPIIDYDNRVVGLETLIDPAQDMELGNAVLLMAGGRGVRLSPLTRSDPKPLLAVGDRPLLETLILEMSAQGFRSFFISIRYLGEKIRRHFQDGERLGVRIEYLVESEALGTAGALALLPEALSEPVIVVNGDVLTKLNFRTLLQFHEGNDAAATMCVSEYSMTVPYGVVAMSGRRVVGIEEKPHSRYLINAGIYVLSPDVMGLIPRDEGYDMTELLARLIREGRNVAAFPIREYWRDVGRADDLERARHDFGELFD